MGEFKVWQVQGVVMAAVVVPRAAVELNVREVEGAIEVAQTPLMLLQLLCGA